MKYTSHATSHNKFYSGIRERIENCFVMGHMFLVGGMR